jgi:hypothetical protein
VVDFHTGSESTDPVGRRTTAIADANIGAPPGIDDDDGEDTIEYLEAHFVEALEQGDVLDALAWTMGTCLNGASPRLRTLQLERRLRRVSPALGRWRRRGAREPPDDGGASDRTLHFNASVAVRGPRADAAPREVWSASALGRWRRRGAREPRREAADDGEAPFEPAPFEPAPLQHE